VRETISYDDPHTDKLRTSVYRISRCADVPGQAVSVLSVL